MIDDDKKGLGEFLGSNVVLKIFEPDQRVLKRKYGKLVSYDDTHIVIIFTKGSRTGAKQAYPRHNIKLVEFDDIQDNSDERHVNNRVTGGGPDR